MASTHSWRTAKVGCTLWLFSLPLGRDPKLLADRLKVRERDVVEMDQRLGSWELSLDQPMTDEGEGTFHDLLPSPQVGVDEQLGKNQLRVVFRKKLAEFAEALNEREEDILRPGPDLVSLLNTKR